jgi:hypothetical protein
MPWLQIRLATLPEHSEILEDALLLAGCKAVTLIDTDDQPVYEPIRGTTPLWQHTTIQGLFEEDIDVAHLLALMDSVIDAHQLRVAAISTEILEDKDWEREWMDNFKPIACGDRTLLANAPKSGWGQPKAGPRPGVWYRHTPHDFSLLAMVKRPYPAWRYDLGLWLWLGHFGASGPIAGCRAHDGYRY